MARPTKRKARPPTARKAHRRGDRQHGRSGAGEEVVGQGGRSDERGRARFRRPAGVKRAPRAGPRPPAGVRAGGTVRTELGDHSEQPGEGRHDSGGRGTGGTGDLGEEGDGRSRAARRAGRGRGFRRRRRARRPAAWLQAAAGGENQQLASSRSRHAGRTTLTQDRPGQALLTGMPIATREAGRDALPRPSLARALQALSLAAARVASGQPASQGARVGRCSCCSRPPSSRAPSPAHSSRTACARAALEGSWSSSRLVPGLRPPIRTNARANQARASLALGPSLRQRHRRPVLARLAWLAAGLWRQGRRLPPPVLHLVWSLALLSTRAAMSSPTTHPTPFPASPTSFTPRQEIVEAQRGEGTARQLAAGWLTLSGTSVVRLSSVQPEVRLPPCERGAARGLLTDIHLLGRLRGTCSSSRRCRPCSPPPPLLHLPLPSQFERPSPRRPRPRRATLLLPRSSLPSHEPRPPTRSSSSPRPLQASPTSSTLSAHKAHLERRCPARRCRPTRVVCGRSACSAARRSRSPAARAVCASREGSLAARPSARNGRWAGRRGRWRRTRNWSASFRPCSLSRLRSPADLTSARALQVCAALRRDRRDHHPVRLVDRLARPGRDAQGARPRPVSLRRAGR